jgi:hypothetical protein
MNSQARTLFLLVTPCLVLLNLLRSSYYVKQAVPPVNFAYHHLAKKLALSTKTTPITTKESSPSSHPSETMTTNNATKTTTSTSPLPNFSTSNTTSAATTTTNYATHTSTSTPSPPQKPPTPTKKTTKIIGFSDEGYKEIALNWYQELHVLGYTEHFVAAQDRPAADYFAQQQQQDDDGTTRMRFDLLSPESNRSLKDDCSFYYDNLKPPGRATQAYRRSLFGSRWHYILGQLEQGHHVLVTDVDNVFVRHQSMTEFEDSEYDVYHAYAGTVPSFPVNVFKVQGFTICGGMSWLRSTPPVLEFVRALVETCRCAKLDCSCRCDDQVILNRMISSQGDYRIDWDQTNRTVPQTESEMSWEGLTGVCRKTGHRVRIWDRHTAYRAPFSTNQCPDPAKNWIAMPTGVDKGNISQVWNEACGNTNHSFDQRTAADGRVPQRAT